MPSDSARTQFLREFAAFKAAQKALQKSPMRDNQAESYRFKVDRDGGVYCLDCADRNASAFRFCAGGSVERGSLVECCICGEDIGRFEDGATCNGLGEYPEPPSSPSPATDTQGVEGVEVPKCPTEDGLTAAEWVLRTGKAEQALDAMRAERQAIFLALHPECPAYPGIPNKCDEAVCDCFAADHLAEQITLLRSK